MNNKQQIPETGPHRMQIRMNKKLHTYLENLSYKTNLDISQLIRLLIWMAPDNKEFNEYINRYVREDRRGLIFITDFRDNDRLWRDIK